MNYLITGGAGFIGSHLADALIARGDSVTLLDNCSTGEVRNIDHLLDDPHVSFVQGTIMDEALVRKLIGEVDVVVHLAASVGVRLIIERPLESLLNNIRGTEIVLQACAEAVRKVLVASTSEIYGKSGGEVALREDSDRVLGSPFVSRWSYSTSKAVDEILAYNYWRTAGTPSIVARLFNCAGPRQTGEYGMVIPRFIRQALEGEDLTVYGDGRQRRSFCHVFDMVAGLLSLLDHPDAVGDVFNVGAPQEITITDLAERVIQLTDSPSQIVKVPYEEAYEEGFEDMERRFPDITKISGLTGWAPARQVDDILRDVIAHEEAAAGASTDGGG